MASPRSASQCAPQQFPQRLWQRLLLVSWHATEEGGGCTHALMAYPCWHCARHFGALDPTMSPQNSCLERLCGCYECDWTRCKKTMRWMLISRSTDVAYPPSNAHAFACVSVRAMWACYAVAHKADLVGLVARPHGTSIVDMHAKQLCACIRARARARPAGVGLCGSHAQPCGLGQPPLPCRPSRCRAAAAHTPLFISPTVHRGRPQPCWCVWAGADLRSRRAHVAARETSSN